MRLIDEPLERCRPAEPEPDVARLELERDRGAAPVQRVGVQDPAGAVLPQDPGAVDGRTLRERQSRLPIDVAREDLHGARIGRERRRREAGELQDPRDAGAVELGRPRHIADRAPAQAREVAGGDDPRPREIDRIPADLDIGDLAVETRVLDAAQDGREPDAGADRRLCRQHADELERRRRRFRL